MLNTTLRDELLAMQQADLDMRRALIDRGELFEGYHPEMAGVHQANNVRLNSILDEFGWPGRSLVGDAASEAAWKIAQHAILDPAVQERSLLLLENAVRQGEAPAWQLAMLTDRVLVESDKPQRHGSILATGENGLEPLPIEDPDRVEERRREVDLPPLAEHLANLRAKAAFEARISAAAAYVPDVDTFDTACGHFSISGGERVHIFRDADHLMGQLGDQPPVELIPEAPSRFLICEVYGVLTFDVNESGEAVGFTLIFDNQTLVGTRY